MGRYVTRLKVEEKARIKTKVGIELGCTLNFNADQHTFRIKERMPNRSATDLHHMLIKDITFSLPHLSDDPENWTRKFYMSSSIHFDNHILLFFLFFFETEPKNRQASTKTNAVLLQTKGVTN